MATDVKGVRLGVEQKAKGLWKIETKNLSEIDVTYEIYAHELTVRTSHVDSSHAFLHGPSYLMGVFGAKVLNPEIEFRFPGLWSKLSTSLKEISPTRDRFVYTAADYDELIDCPVEIGCHETDGFIHEGREHHLAFYGDLYPHKQNLKEDIKKIVAWITGEMKDIPYEKYLFIHHFAPRLYGGLEHLNSTALHFDSRKFLVRKDYLQYLCLVSHEYFHLWNVKRIRPRELGPFDYLNEGYTSMLWLAEGLTSFMDEWFIYRAGLCSLEEYLDMQKTNFDAYLKTPGRKFHSLEESSFNAWVKLYRPDENSRNSSISYYLKGGIVFFVLHSMLVKKNRSMMEVVQELWKHYLGRPERGLSRDEVYAIIEKVGGAEVREAFSVMVETTQDLPFEKACMDLGLEFRWNESSESWLGLEYDFEGSRVFVKSVLLDSPGYKAGLNAGDELVFIDHHRIIREDVEKWGQWLLADRSYHFTASRLSRRVDLSVTPGKAPRVLKEIVYKDKEEVEGKLRL
jgi:predicted metalloprotease with PDZ domain